jgi:hypothetical protein
MSAIVKMKFILLYCLIYTSNYEFEIRVFAQSFGLEAGLKENKKICCV